MGYHRRPRDYVACTRRKQANQGPASPTQQSRPLLRLTHSSTGSHKDDETHCDVKPASDSGGRGDEQAKFNRAMSVAITKELHDELVMFGVPKFVHELKRMPKHIQDFWLEAMKAEIHNLETVHKAITIYCHARVN